MTTVADEVVRRLESYGTSTVFGYPGETSLSIYAALQRNASVAHVIGRCPRGAAYAAEAYARITGRVAVCDAPGGIGSPYCTPALLEAFNSGTPLVLFTSGPSKSTPRAWATGQVEHSRLFESISKRVFVVREQRGALSLIDAAFALAEQPRRGPVVIEIAPDVLEAQADHELLDDPQATEADASSSTAEATLIEQAVASAACAIAGASRVAVVAGGGCHSAGSAEAVKQFVDRFKVPVFTTLNGKGVLAEAGVEAPRVIGSKGDTPANEFIGGCDVVVYVGSKMGDKSTNQYSWPGLGQYLVRIDNDPNVDGIEVERGCLLRDDVGVALEALSCQLQEWTYRGDRPVTKAGGWSRSGTSFVVDMVDSMMGSADVCVGEASVSSGWFGALLHLTPPQRLVTPRGTGSLGYAVPASVGAALARPESTVWSLVGDGGLTMSIGELETIARLRLNVKIIVLDNGHLNLIDQHAIHHHDATAVSRDFIKIDWYKVCEAMGISAMNCGEPIQSSSEIKEFLSGDGPVVLILETSIDEVSPDMAIAIRKVH